MIDIHLTSFTFLTDSSQNINHSQLRHLSPQSLQRGWLTDCIPSRCVTITCSSLRRLSLLSAWSNSSLGSPARIAIESDADLIPVVSQSNESDDASPSRAPDFRTTEKTTLPSESTGHTHHALSAMEQVKTREWLVLANFPQSLHQLRSNWYLGTNAILLRNVEDDESSPANVHTQIF